MAVICAACREPNRPGARYCDACGTRLDDSRAVPGHDRTIERRPVTVAFCDLAQSTRLANTLDVDDLRVVFRHFREIVEAVVRQHDGHEIRPLHTAVQFNGDGAFILFGYPQARDDAAECAVDAGLSLIAGIRRARPVAGVTLDARVGIASGTAVTGDLQREAATHQESVVGSVVHLAARLVAEAQPGEVVIDEATRRLAGRFFEYRPLGGLHLKGFDLPVDGWLVLQPSSIQSRFEAKQSDDPASPLVGRRDELAQVRRCWAEALESHGRTIFVDGDAGVGKSRLAREARRDALGAGATVIDLDCSRRARHTPFAPVATALRRMVRAPETSTATAADLERWLAAVLGIEAAAAALPYVGAVLGFDTPPADAAESPDRIRQRTIEILVEIVLALADRRPVFLLWEDAHWSDATTAEFVARLRADGAARRLLIVATARAGEALSATLVAPDLVRISLRALGQAESADVVRLIAGERALAADVLDRIVAYCQGNALHLEEETRHAIETAGQGGTGPAPRRPARELPERIRVIVQERLDRWPRTKPVIQAAAVVGRDFTLPVLQLLLPDRTDVAESVALLADRDLLVADPHGTADGFRFKHALIHDAVYDAIVRSERQRLHSQAADVLARHLAGSADAAPDVLAHHLAEAQRHEESVAAYASAIDLAAGRAAHSEAIGHCTAALARTDHVTADGTRRQLQRRVLIRLGVSLAAIKGYSDHEVLHAYQQARTRCAAQDDPDELFPVVRGLGTFHFVRGDILEADALSQECLGLARRSGHPEHLIEALSFSAYTAHYRGKLREARADSERCLELYRAERGERFIYPSAQDPATAALSLLPTTTWLLGDSGASETGLDALLAHVAALGRPFDEAYARVWIAGLRHLQRRTDEALAEASAAVAIAHQHGYHTWLATGMMMAAMARALGPAAGDALGQLRATHQLFMSSGARVSASFYLWGQARALRIAGDAAGAAEAIAQAMAIAEASGETYMLPELLIVAAELETDPRRVRALHERASAAARTQHALTLALRASILRQLDEARPRGLDGDAVSSWLAMLDGRTSYPRDRSWIPDALRSLTDPAADRFVRER